MEQGIGNLNVDIGALPTFECSCGSDVWLNGAVIKMLGKIQSPSGKDELINVPIVFCIQCGKRFEEVQQSKETEKTSSIITPG